MPKVRGSALFLPGLLTGVAVVAMFVPRAPVEAMLSFSDDSPWTNLLPASPTAHASSAAFVTKMVTTWGGPALLEVGTFGTSSDFSTPLYQAIVTDPLFTISASSNNARSFQIQGTQIRIPDAALATVGSDHHLVVIDENQEWVYEFWNVTSKPAGGGTLACGQAGRTRYHGDGFDNPNAYASKTAAMGGAVTVEELEAGHIPHPLALIVKSTNNTMAWPASGLAGATDATDAPPNGTLFRLTYTEAEINALSVPADTKTILQAFREYGGYVVDTGGSSFNIRFKGDGTKASFPGGSELLKAYAIANGWTLSGGFYYLDIETGVDWAGKLQAISSSYMQGLYDTRIAYKKLDPSATISSAWSNTGAATAHEALFETTYAPFPESSTLRIGSQTLGHVCTVRVETLTVPTGKTLVGLTLWVNGNTAAAQAWSAKLKHGTTTLGTYTMPVNSNYGWRAVTYTGDMTGVDLADIRMEFEITTGGAFCNIRAAHVMAEFVGDAESGFVFSMDFSDARNSGYVAAIIGV